ncbi:non-ribosomal peptide synthetase [Pseudomonas guariconensis]|uniref:non-ribosomal peptide synthetase n=1 Tax=Pseudomonas guariconensis TaxID=1288410 RepID=UPI0018ABAB13|nr:non-ribosomal peptide synthetase [Pseudomonas guariconensis]MBF8739592.1 amino acid adenylation domain-containing protein [Pseudomonas guariconensis]MBF8749995.1 amino acid adenylation domain-containing protein [Pseudomonas guariconensis]
MTVADRSLALARRFAELDPAARRALGEKLKAQGMSLESLPIPPRARTEAAVAASYAQRRLWTLWQLDRSSAAYNQAGVLRLDGALDVAALQSALDALVARHEILRTRFAEMDGQLAQLVSPAAGLALARLDVSTSSDPEAALKVALQAAAAQAFDLYQGPLLQVTLVRLGEQRHGLLLAMHHIISDGWSMQILLDELAQGYAAHLQGQAAQLPALAVQYADYALWQRNWLEAGEGERQLAYWRTTLGERPPILELPADRARPAEMSQRGASLGFELPQAVTVQLKALAATSGTSLFMVLLAAFKAVLHRYTGQEELLVGVPVANRQRREVQGLIGFFVNTQVLRSTPHARLPFRALLDDVRQAASAAQDCQDLPFEELVDALGVERSLSRNPLFQVMFNHEQRGEATLKGLPGLQAWLEVATPEVAKFDLSLDTEELAGGLLRGAFTYATDLFDAARIERLRGHFLRLLADCAERPDTALGDLAMLDSHEQRQVVEAFNATAIDYRQPQCLQVLIEAQVAATPQAIALIADGAELSYAELNAQANRLAHYLRSRGVGPEQLVGILAERSQAMVVALLAVLKAGAAYVPLDPDQPDQRLAYMLDDSGASLLLTQQHLLGRLPTGEREVLCLDDAACFADHPDSNPSLLSHPDQLAYCIYTSGTTGRPKGAGNSHAALCNRLQWMQATFTLEPQDRVLQKTPFGFDVSVWEFFWPLMTGATLVMAPPGAHRDPAELKALIAGHGISVLHFVPSMLQAYMASETLAGCPSLRLVMCSGEALPLDLQQRFLAQSEAGLHNLYGPTEAAIDVSHWACHDAPGLGSVPIGRPIANLRLYVLDGQLQPVAQGLPGELYIGGVGLARGYLGRPGLTAERFVADPFGQGGRLYRTGDLARWRDDGAVEYLGRIDHQVKIRGLRIELGEIEARLLEHPAVSEAVVVVSEAAAGARQLLGYVVANDADGLADTLRLRLGEALPDYMVPAQIVVLAQMPLSANGKLDRKALPQPMLVERAYDAPHGEVEQGLARIWSEVLGIDPVGAMDNFFELGGDSIIAIQVASRARQAGWQFGPRELFRHQTLRQLAQVVTPLGGQDAVTARPERGPIALTPFQQRFFATAMARRGHWNQALLLALDAPLTAARLEQALNTVVAHHDAFSLRFAQHEHGWQATYEAPGAVKLWVREAEDEQALIAIANQAQRSLDLATGPLLRAVLIDLHGTGQRLLLAAHHLVVDGVSWRIVLEDLQQLLADPAASLPRRSHAFGDWTRFLAERAMAAETLAQLPWWLAQLGEVPAAFPGARHTGLAPVGEAVTLPLQLDEALTRQLLRDAPGAYRTQVNDLLLCSLTRAWRRWSAQAELLVELESHGREEHLAGLDLGRTVGWFTATYPVRLRASDDLGCSLKMIKEQLRQVPDNGLGFGLLQQLAPAEVRAQLAARPQPRVTFNYLGQFDASFGAGMRRADESCGDSQDPAAPLGNWLSIDGGVTKGRLQLGFTFSPQQLDAQGLTQLVALFEDELRALVAHCLAPDVGGATPSDFPLAGLDQARLDALALPLTQVQDLYPLSPMQQGMLFHSLYQPGDGSYINQVRMDVEGLDPARLRTAWQAALDSHAALRTAFVSSSAGQPLQAVLRHAELAWREVTGGDLDAQAADERRPFDLQQPPLMRLLLVTTGAGRHHLVWTCHHLLLDGWSQAQLFAEVMERYAGRALPTPVGQYRDYIAWLAERDLAASEQFWRDQLAPLQAPTALAGAVALEQPGIGIAEHRSTLSLVASERLRQFARQRKVTLSSLLQAAWLLLLQRYTGQDCVAFGATVAGRPAQLPGIEQQLGLFINTLPMVACPQGQLSVGQWLDQVQAQGVAVREHEHSALYDIQRWAGQGGQGLFDQILVFENYPLDSAMLSGQGDGPRFANLVSREQGNYPLMLLVNQGEVLSFCYSFDRACFDAPAIERMDGHLQQLLQALCESADRQLGQLPLLSAAERSQVLTASAANSHGIGAFDLVERFERQVARDPHAIAVRQGETVVGYGELNCRANRLAHRLQAAGVGPDVRVGVCLERTPQLLVALLAVLKAGGAYVPLDPEFPAERLRHMLDDSRAPLLLSQSSLQPTLQALGAEAECWWLDRLDEQGSETNPAVQALGDHLAYVIYTSGSTGKPKGVAVRRAGVGNFLASMAQAPGLAGDGRMLALTSLSFDIAVLELYLPLVSGASVVLVDRDTARDPDRLWAQIEGQQVTAIQATPSTWRMLAEHPRLPSLAGRQVLCGGEALPADLAERLIAVAGGLWNLYGPTETSVWSARCHLQGEQPVMLGEALAHTALHVLDEDLEPLPLGVAGELYIGGEGLARGYHDRPGLTAERFVADPFGSGGRLYRTGDLVRRRADGALEYLGRIDQQVKIRGFRIELGEIEACLLAEPGVREAAVVARQGQLVGYVVADDEALLPRLRERLQEQLPDYMVPARLMRLERMPLTPNRKLDRKALPEPELQAREHVAPEGEVECTLAQIWQTVLNLPQVGAEDNFFELGGDSIVSVQVVARAREAGLALTPRDLFEQQSIRRLAKVAGQLTATTMTVVSSGLEQLSVADRARLPVAPEVLEDAYPLSPMQQGLLFHGLSGTDKGVYINQLAFDLHDLEPQRLHAAWQQLIERHPILRSGFAWEGLEQPLQLVYRQVPQLWAEQDWRGRDCSPEALDAFASEQRSLPFDFAEPALQRVALLRLTSGCYRLVWTYHHLLLDGWSSARLIEEWLGRYGGEASQVEAGRYGDYIAWLQRQDPQRGEAFWKARTAQLDAPTLLADNALLQAGNAGQHTFEFLLDAPQSEALTAFARSQRVTLNTLVQAAWLLLLQRHSGQRVVCCGATLSGRPAELAGSGDMLGLFINTLPLIAEPVAHQPLGEWLQALQEETLALQELAHVPLYDVQRWAGSAGQSLFDTLLVFENYPVDAALRSQAMQRLRIEGVSQRESTHYPLTLTVNPGECLQLTLAARADAFCEGTLAQLVEHLGELLRSIPGDPQRRLGELAMLTPQARRHALARAAQQPVLGTGQSLPVLFAEQVRRAGTLCAVSDGSVSLDYISLDQASTRLARHLLAHGVGADSLVAVCLERDAQLLVTLLAVLKAGAAYVPLDPEFPAQRLRHMLDDSGARWLLTHSALLPQLPEATTGQQRWCLDQLALPDDESTTLPSIDPQQLAYVIYTSGSTGLPKGVAVRHGALANFLLSMAEAPGLASGEKMLALTSLSFDIAALELYLPLLQGASVVMADRAMARDAGRLLDYIVAQDVGCVQATPSTWRMLTEHPRFASLQGLRALCGGEALAGDLAERLQGVVAALWNLYGPTETTIWSARMRLGQDAHQVQLGEPIAGTSLHVLDDSLEPTADGVAGELYIGGAGLARGYHRRPGLTAERFVADPFGAPGQRLYRTGDLVRWRGNALEYIGRIDQQVKIRGHRIELGEIEACLRRCAGVREAAVVARPGPAGTVLVGYAEADDAPQLAVELKQALQAALPDYMVPAQVVVLTRMPLTPNGKLDRKALPAPDWQARQHVEPSTVLERQLATIWCEVLGLKRVGSNDDFFELGGHSLLLTRLVSRVREVLGVDLAMHEFFDHPSVGALAARLESAPPVADDLLEVDFMNDLLEELEQAE